MMPILSLDHVKKSYGKGDRLVYAVDDVSLRLDAGAFTAVCGPSGCGKTTLLLVAGGLMRPNEGEVTVMGEALYALPVEKRAAFRARHIGFVFQQFHLIPYLTVQENVMVPCGKDARSKARPYADALLERFGLRGHADKKPAALSTGERQRVALARAMINRPTLLLADEPTGNLDDENGSIVLDAMAAFASEGGAVLLVTHDNNATARAHETVEMCAGRFV